MDSEEHTGNSAEKRKRKPSFTTPELTIGSLRNHNGDPEDNVDLKNHESRNTLESFTLFITVKTIAKLTPERNDKFEIKI